MRHHRKHHSIRFLAGLLAGLMIMTSIPAYADSAAGAPDNAVMNRLLTDETDPEAAGVDESAAADDPAGPSRSSQGESLTALTESEEEEQAKEAEDPAAEMPPAEMQPAEMSPAQSDLADSSSEDYDDTETAGSDEAEGDLAEEDADEEEPAVIDETETDDLPPIPPGGYEDPGYVFGTTESAGEAPLGEEILMQAGSQPAAYSLINVSSYFPELNHSFTYPGNYVTGVKNQGNYNLCWAFSGVAAAESNLIKKGKATTSLDLSEVQLGYYTQFRNQSMSPAGCENDTAYLTSSFGSIGGNQFNVISSVTRRVGLIDESRAPYSMLDTGLTSSLTNGTLAKNYARYYMKNASVVLGSDKTKIKMLIQTYGAAACSVYFGNYDYYNRTTNAMYCGDSLTTTHAGVIVGWDDNYPRTNFRSDRSRPGMNGAWLIKNSWGTSSNKNGYYWLSYEDKPFCSANVFVYDMIAASEDEPYIYQLDGGIYSGTEKFGTSNEAHMANVFKATGSQDLTAVSFYTKEDELDYQISVYTNVSNKPNDGKLQSASTTSGHCTYAGYHTVSLRTPASLIRNEKYAVVIRLSDPYKRGEVHLYYERNSKAGENVVSSVTCKTGESFYSSNGKSWTDRAVKGYQGNYRIKAFARDKALITQRLSGADRYSTMALIARQAFPEGASEVIMVTGQKFPDALSAAPYAGTKNCPLLITPLTSLNASVKELLATTWGKKVKKVTFIGGGFSSAVINTLRNSCGVTSFDTTTFAGKDRYDTACRVCEQGLKAGYFNKDACVVATGAKPADALSMSPWAYYYRMPILLVNKNGEMSSKATSLLKNFNRVYAVGGTNVVPERVLYGKGPEIVRLSGESRYATSVAIARYFVYRSDGSDGRPVHNDHFAETVIFAPGSDKNFPDALVGAMLGGHLNNFTKPGPIVLVPAGTVEDITLSYVNQYRPALNYKLCAFYLGAVSEQNERIINSCLNSQIS